jgi:hypothetical protein
MRSSSRPVPLSVRCSLACGICSAYNYGGGLETVLTGTEDSTMPRVKQASKKKHVTKAVPAMGAAGLTFSLMGGASAAALPTADVQATPNNTLHQVTLGEEELSDVSLATFYVFDKENTAAAKNGVQVAWRGCGGCRGCRGCGGCRACRGCAGCAGCGGCGCCLSWGSCRIC